MDPATDLCAARDILIGDGVILELGDPGSLDATACDRVLDADGLVIAPGLVDGHVHFRDPGQTHKEDIYTGAAAAVKGGFTSVIMMGNTTPPPDSPERVEELYARAEGLPIHAYTCGNVTVGMRGQVLTDMEALAKAGAVLFSDDGKPIIEESVMRRACVQALKLGRVISLHEEDPSYILDNGINASVVARRLGIDGSMRAAEISMVRRDIEIARDIGAELMVQHISAAESVELIRRARAEGIRIHAEATPHHFTLTDEAVKEYGPLARMNPPLRTSADREAIIGGLSDGTIEVIATDHAPHTLEEKFAGRKESPGQTPHWDPEAKDAADILRSAPSGITGLETSLGLSVRELSGHMSLMRILKCMTIGPAGIYGLDKIAGAGMIREGGPADLCLFKPDETWTFDSTVSRSANTPFLGQSMPARVHYTICRGRIVYG